MEQRQRAEPAVLRARAPRSSARGQRRWRAWLAYGELHRLRRAPWCPRCGSTRVHRVGVDRGRGAARPPPRPSSGSRRPSQPRAPARARASAGRAGTSTAPRRGSGVEQRRRTRARAGRVVATRSPAPHAERGQPAGRGRGAPRPARIGQRPAVGDTAPGDRGAYALLCQATRPAQLSYGAAMATREWTEEQAQRRVRPAADWRADGRLRGHPLRGGGGHREAHDRPAGGAQRLPPRDPDRALGRARARPRGHRGRA